MFSEILRIKPVLDQGTTKQMEANLSARFAKVAQRFGAGLKSVVKGSILGISLGLLNKLLNPIEALEDKIKGLLTKGTDIRDMADELNTSPGQLKRLQDVAQSLGVQPDQLKEMLSKYSAAVSQARKELEDPTAEISSSSRAVKNFTNEKDTVEGFFKFLQSLKAEGQGPGRDVFFGEKQQRLALERERKGETLSEEERQALISERLLKRQTGLESRQSIEELIFGQKQSGAGKRLIEADFQQQFKKINEPEAATLDKAINKTAGLADEQRALQVQRETQDFLNASQKLNLEMIKRMEKAQALEDERATKQLDSYADLRKAADGIEEVKTLLTGVLTHATKGVGFLGELTARFVKIAESRIFRGLFKDGGN